MDKKGSYVQGFKTPYMIIAIFIIAVMLSAIGGTVLTYQKSSLTCFDNIIDEVMLAKSLYSSECFVYVNEDTNRAMPGTIDLDKFTQENYGTCFKFITKKMQMTIGDATIGEELSKPTIVQKPIHVYEEGKITPSTLTFTFSEAAC
jgi:hypothetical protein